MRERSVIVIGSTAPGRQGRRWRFGAGLAMLIMSGVAVGARPTPASQDYDLSIQPIERPDAQGRATAVVKLTVGPAAEPPAEATLWWTTPGGRRASIPLRPVQENLWAVPMELPSEAGEHRLALILIGRGESDAPAWVRTRTFLATLPQLRLTVQREQQWQTASGTPEEPPTGGEEFSELAVATASPDGVSGWVWTGWIALLAVGFAAAGWVTMHRHGAGRRQAVLTAAASPPAAPEEPPAAAPPLATPAPDAPTEPGPPAVPEAVLTAQQRLASMIGRTDPAAASALGERVATATAPPKDAAAAPAMPDPEALSTAEVINSLQMTMEQAASESAAPSEAGHAAANDETLDFSNLSF